MLSAVIHSIHSYPAFTVGTITGTPEVCPSRSSRTKEGSSQYSNAYTGYGPNCLTTFWTQLAYRFHGRTAQPLGRTTAPGCDEPTSRCQTSPSMWTLGGDQPVIPRVTFIRWVTAFPLSIYRQITKTDFRPCLTCRSHSQAFFCLYTLDTISTRSEKTFVRLRYHLGGDRPSQTARLKMFFYQIMEKVRNLTSQEWYLIDSSRIPARIFRRLPPMLREWSPISISSYSKAS